MTLKERIESFSELGKVLRDSLDGREFGFTQNLEQRINNQQYSNPWFTPENVRMALKAIAGELTYDNLIRWTGNYPALDSVTKPCKVGVVMAGNIPLVGFHDFISVMITGNILIAKTSSKDPDLLVFISDILCRINPGFKDKVFFSKDLLKGFDLVIATGGDNSSRYFEYYFGKYPHIIRKNRNSVAIIRGDETIDDLTHLGTDIFSYFGLGCRNVSKIYIPAGYDLSEFKDLWYSFAEIINHNKYANNYDYNKAVFMVNNESYLDTGFILLKEDQKISSPVAVLYFEHYDSLDLVKNRNEIYKEKIQCIVGKNYTPFGMAQFPHLWDYADGIDTIEFILKKNMPGIL